MNSIIAIDPGPLVFGAIAIVEGDLLKTLPSSSIEEILNIKVDITDVILIEVCDFPIKNAGESFRDTSINIGRIYQHFHKRCPVIFLGRKELVNKMPKEFTRNDSGVRSFCLSKGFKGLKSHNWQALGMALIYKYL